LKAGFRSDRPFVSRRTPGTRRVLLFGDSFTAADAVSNGERYSDILERTVPAVEVYNYALPGTGTDQQYLAWREFARDVDHDVVVIAVLVENIRRVLARYRPYLDGAGRQAVYAKPYFTLDQDRLVLHHVPPQPAPVDPTALPAEDREAIDTGGRFEGVRRAVKALGAQEAVQRITRYQPVPEFDSPGTPGWQLMRAILSQWIRAVDTRVVLMPLPLYQHVEETSDASAYRDRFRELAAEVGCVLHDPLGDLLDYSPAQRRAFRFERDIHPTPAAHRAIAASLAPVVASLLDGRG
jgi:hypothetical protein